MKTRYNVYLAGSIGGFTWDEIMTWRYAVTRKFNTLHESGLGSFFALDPMRSASYSQFGNTGIVSSVYETDKTAAYDIISKKDFRDVQAADALIVNILKSDTVPHSVGTLMEIAWAYANRTPVVAIGDHPSYNHPMVREAIWHKVETTDDAVYKLKDIFGV